MSTEAITLDFKPYPHQRAAHLLMLTFRFLVLVWHRRAGKTVWAVVELILAALRCKRERGRFGYVAPFLKQAKAASWDYLKHFAWRIPGCIVNEAELSVEFPNGARVRLFGADNPDSLRGMYFDGIVLDEVADMRPQVWGEIIRPALADREGWAIFIGTPKGVNLFSDLFHRAQKEEGWHADTRRASDTGVLSKAELEKSRREMTPSQYAQEMECDFAASVDNVLFRLNDVLAAMRRSVPEVDFSYAAKVLGVDCARYGDDTTVLTPRQGIVTFKPVPLAKSDTMTTAGRIALGIDRWKPDAVFIDNGTFGAGVVDRLRQLKYQVTGVDFGSSPMLPRFENKRAEMWWDASEWMKSGGVLPDVTELSRDLTGPRYDYKNAHGRIQLESKDEMRARGLKSPDYGDSFALTFAFPVAPRDEAGNRESQKTEHDFEPYERGSADVPLTIHDFDPYGGPL